MYPADLSHRITSPTALRMPVEAICARAHQTGILPVVDGAHAPDKFRCTLRPLYSAPICGKKEVNKSNPLRNNLCDLSAFA